MTTSRCERISSEDVELQFVTSEEPDTIGVEIMFRGNMIFDITYGRGGSRTIMFDDATGAEFELSEFRKLMERCEAELRAWEERLAAPGEIGSGEP